VPIGHDRARRAFAKERTQALIEEVYAADELKYPFIDPKRTRGQHRPAPDLDQAHATKRCRVGDGAPMAIAEPLKRLSSRHRAVSKLVCGLGPPCRELGINLDSRHQEQQVTLERCESEGRLNYVDRRRGRHIGPGRGRRCLGTVEAVITGGPRRLGQDGRDPPELCD
jgi:hypothetical protein